MTRVMRYKDSLSLAYAEYGQAKGFPILVQHGMVASIRDGSLFERLVAAGMRVIIAARPGYGESSPYAMRDMAEWGDIAAALAAELGLEAFDVLATSSGAPYGYAIAHRMPERVRGVFVFSGTPALYRDEVLALWPYPVDKKASLPELQKAARDIFFPGQNTAGQLPDDVADSMANDCFGPALDLMIRCRDWGFRLGDVAQRVHMEHCREDEQVPFASAELTSKLLPNCTFAARPSGGHFSPELLNAFIERAVIPAARPVI